MAAMSDVVKVAKVSVSTVWSVLTGARPISAATREKALDATVTLDYQPKALARPATD